ncbi:Replication protein A DNA-binding subunit B [Glycine soja]
MNKGEDVGLDGAAGRTVVEGAGDAPGSSPRTVGAHDEGRGRRLELAGLCNFMARIPDKIRSINGSKETLKLAVRITDLWFVGTPNKSEQAEMVFVDSEGDQIHVICKSDHLKSWKADLKENCTYVMHNFKVVKNDGQFRVCEHEYKLFFIGVTVVREADLHELPFKEFRFVEFPNVVAGNFVSGLLVDIIGVVDQVVFRHVSSKNTRVVFRMKDLSGEILSCILWENYCIQFLSYLNERGDDGPMVIILTHVRIKDAQALVSNSFKASKLFINDPILEIHKFKERLLDLGVEVTPVLLPGDQASSQVSGGSQLSSKDLFLSKAEVKTIFEINGIFEDVVCVTVGTISKIVMDNHSWCYPACVQCHRKTDIQTGPFTCGCGKDNDQPVLRYRVEVMVTQNNESNKFLLWDRECAELIGETADDVNRVKIEDGDLDLNASPQALDKLLGHVLAFKVRIQSKFKNAVVLRYSNDLDLINVVLKMLPDSEACSKIDPSNVDCNNTMHAKCNYQHAKRSDSAKARINRKRIMQQKRHGHAQSSSQPINYQHAKRCDSAKARINRKRIMQQKRHAHAQSSSPPTVNCTSEYNMIVSDSSESENSESTQGSDSNFMTPFEDCQSPTNQPVINIEGYSDLSDQLIQCRYCNAQIQYSGIQSHIVSALSHMLDQHNSHAKSFRMARDRLAGDQPNNIKLQLIAARGKDGRAYNMPNVPEIVALIIGDFHPGSKRYIIVETQNGELQRIHELHPSYLPLQYPLLFPYGEDEYRADILHRSTSSSKKRKRNRLTMREWFAYRFQSRSNEAQTLLHSRKLFQQFIVEGYTMVESERLSYIRNNQKKLRVDKYSSLQTSLDTRMAKGLTKGKRVILPSTSNDDTLRNLTLIEIEQLLHINQRSLKDYPTMPYPQDINLTSYLQNNLVLPINADEQKTIYHRIIQVVNNNEGGMFFLYEFGGIGKTFIWRTLASSLRAENQIVIIVASSGITSLLVPGGRIAHSRFKIPIPIFEDSTCNIHQGTELAELLNQTKKPNMSISSSTASTRIRYPIVRPPAIIQFRAAFHNDKTFIEIPPFYHEQWAPNYPQEVRFKYNGATYPIRVQQHRGRYFFADELADVRADLKIYEKNAHPLQWDVVTLDRDIKDKSIVRPWYKFLRENDFHHGDEVKASNRS